MPRSLAARQLEVVRATAISLVLNRRACAFRLFLRCEYASRTDRRGGLGKCEKYTANFHPPLRGGVAFWQGYRRAVFPSKPAQTKSSRRLGSLNPSTFCCHNAHRSASRCSHAPSRSIRRTVVLIADPLSSRAYTSSSALRTLVSMRINQTGSRGGQQIGLRVLQAPANVRPVARVLRKFNAGPRNGS